MASRTPPATATKSADHGGSAAPSSNSPWQKSSVGESERSGCESRSQTAGEPEVRRALLGRKRGDAESRQLRDGAGRGRSFAGALCEATVALTRSLDRETVLGTLLERLGRWVPFDRASVMPIEEAQRGGFTDQRLRADAKTALFRIAQEAMTNAARHANASRVDLLAEKHGDRIRLVIEDNGIGFDSGRAWDGQQIGLIGKRERAEGLSGTFTIETAVGKGTTIVVEVPSDDPNSDS